ncbi:MAG: hypothetical protein KI790_00465 [Cyclobacteriaceae bacterium]|nr:hypothetical protein [Cyclobacteriaceae bacterium HetDA_MAG_MS6]
MRKYLLLSLGLTGVFVLLYSIDSFLPWQFHQYFPWLIGFFFLQSIGISWMLSEGERDRSRFPIYALGSVVLRFVSGILFLMIFFVVGLEDPVPLVIQFMAVYLSYLIFELTVVLANLRPN